MTDKKLILLAREAGFDSFDMADPRLEHFAILVTAAEREACIKVLEANEQFYCRDTIRAGGRNETK